MVYRSGGKETKLYSPSLVVVARRTTLVVSLRISTTASGAGACDESLTNPTTEPNWNCAQTTLHANNMQTIAFADVRMYGSLPKREIADECITRRALLTGPQFRSPGRAPAHPLGQDCDVRTRELLTWRHLHVPIAPDRLNQDAVFRLARNHREAVRTAL